MVETKKVEIVSAFGVTVVVHLMVLVILFFNSLGKLANIHIYTAAWIKSNLILASTATGIFAQL